MDPTWCRQPESERGLAMGKINSFIVKKANKQIETDFNL